MKMLKLSTLLLGIGVAVCAHAEKDKPFMFSVWPSKYTQFPSEDYSVYGLRLAPGCGIAESVYGLDVGSLLIANKEMNGVQISGLYSGAMVVNGLQLGAVNYAGDGFCGVQLGIVNISLAKEKQSNKFQLGLVNYMESAAVKCLPFVNMSF